MASYISVIRTLFYLRLSFYSFSKFWMPPSQLATFFVPSLLPSFLEAKSPMFKPNHSKLHKQHNKTLRAQRLQKIYWYQQAGRASGLLYLLDYQISWYFLLLNIAALLIKYYYFTYPNGKQIDIMKLRSSDLILEFW